MVPRSQPGGGGLGRQADPGIGVRQQGADRARFIRSVQPQDREKIADADPRVRIGGQRMHFGQDRRVPDESQGAERQALEAGVARPEQGEQERLVPRGRVQGHPAHERRGLLGLHRRQIERRRRRGGEQDGEQKGQHGFTP